MNLNHFRLLRVVGKGAFGKVRIVERKDSGLTFALKYIRKDEGKCAVDPLVLESSSTQMEVSQFHRMLLTAFSCALRECA